MQMVGGFFVLIWNLKYWLSDAICRYQEKMSDFLHNQKNYIKQQLAQILSSDTSYYSNL
jgi:hypothetical protein